MRDLLAGAMLEPVKNQQRGELAVCGLEAVRSLAKARPDAVRRFFFLNEHAREFGALCASLAKARRPYRLVENAELEKLSGTVHHQGVVAMVADEGPRRLDENLPRAWADSGARVILLDRVGDDHNLGSIARSAAFFGFAAIVLSERDKAARLTTAAYRVARGALEHIPVYADESAARFLARCKGIIHSVGADNRAKADIRAYRLSTAASSPRGGVPALVVALGNEETGLEADTRAACDELVRIDGSGLVESLNVAQAAAVFLYRFEIGRASCRERG